VLVNREYFCLVLGRDGLVLINRLLEIRGW
jgi:hypothetical protein